MRSKECPDCGNLNFVPELEKLVELDETVRLVEVCRECGVMIGENPLDEEQTISWYLSHNERYKKFRLTHDWNGNKTSRGWILLFRNKNMEDSRVKYAFESQDGGTMATLVEGDFPDEMEIRISNIDDRFKVKGHKSIMSKLTPEEFVDKVQMHLQRREKLTA